MASLLGEKFKASSTASPSPDEDIIEPDLPICDAHHHLWDRRDSLYLLPQLLADAQSGHNIESTVFVDCRAYYRAGVPEELRPIGETEFANGVAAMSASGRYGKIKACEAISSHADLSLGADVGRLLDAHIAAGNGRFRGIRYQACWDPSPDLPNSHTNPGRYLYAQPVFREGLKELIKRKLIFEAWQFHPQIVDVTELARAMPDLRIVLNHVGGPIGIGPYAGRRDEVFAGWSKDIRELATCPNVYIKLGGLGMAFAGFGYETRAGLPSSEELAEAWRPYLETSIEAFGPTRGMFESNFPVDGLSCSYKVLWNTFKRVTSGASVDEKAALYRNTAREFYSIDVAENSV
jgi:predicted TIM-barrel fold metal-dependent hydrolase